jgi:hypothetical protein
MQLARQVQSTGTNGHGGLPFDSFFDTGRHFRSGEFNLLYDSLFGAPPGLQAADATTNNPLNPGQKKNEDTARAGNQTNREVSEYDGK